MKPHNPLYCPTIWISFLLGLLLSGCSTHALTGKMPISHLSMAQTYNQAISGEMKNDSHSTATLPRLRHQVGETQYEMAYQQPTLTDWPFYRLPNPDIVMVVLPHWVEHNGEELVVPVYYTHFSLYSHVHYLNGGMEQYLPS